MTVRMGETYVANGQLTQAGYSALRGTETAVAALQADVAALDAEIAATSFVRLQTSVSASSQPNIDFTGIPSWANRVTITGSALSTNGTSVVIVQIGDSGGVETTGYAGGVMTHVNTGTAAVVNLGSGFSFSFAAGDTAAAVRHFRLTLDRQSGNSWMGSGNGALSNTQYANSVIGTKSLSGALDRIRVTTAGGVDTFDAGSVSISWE